MPWASLSFGGRAPSFAACGSARTHTRVRAKARCALRAQALSEFVVLLVRMGGRSGPRVAFAPPTPPVQGNPGDATKRGSPTRAQPAPGGWRAAGATGT